MQRLAPLILLLAAACGPAVSAPELPPEDPGPKAGQELILPRGKILGLYRESADATLRMGKPIDTLFPGDLIRVIEVHPDHVSVEAIRDQWGDPIGKHGYVRRWW